jgi:hypothetical protein
MDRKHVTISGALLLALFVGAAPALATANAQDGRDRSQDRGSRPRSSDSSSRSTSTARDDRAGSRQSRSSSASASDARRDVAVPRTLQRTETSSRGTDRPYASSNNDRRDQPSSASRSNEGSSASRYDGRTDATRDARPSTSGSDRRSYSYSGGRYDARSYGSGRNDSRRYNSRDSSYRDYGAHYRESRWWTPLRIGLDILMGSPYDYRFDSGWQSSYSYARRFPMRAGMGYGGMSFLVEPDDAAIYVDRRFIGYASEFEGQPVPLTAGWHEVELQARGCETVAFDITVRPGQVIPYRGSLMPYR